MNDFIHEMRNESRDKNDIDDEMMCSIEPGSFDAIKDVFPYLKQIFRNYLIICLKLLD